MSQELGRTIFHKDWTYNITLLRADFFASPFAKGSSETLLRALMNNTSLL